MEAIHKNSIDNWNKQIKLKKFKRNIIPEIWQMNYLRIQKLHMASHEKCLKGNIYSVHRIGIQNLPVVGD